MTCQIIDRSQNRLTPKGYMQDAKGRLVPIETIPAIDLLRDSLVRELSAKAEILAAEVAAFKEDALAQIAAFVSLSAEEYGAAIGGEKGNIQLQTFDGRLRIQRAVADRITFDERLHAAKTLIDQCISEWAAKSTPQLRALVNDAFEVDKAGNINTGRILTLRRIQIEDPRWEAAMCAIADAICIESTKTYLRFYTRDESGKYRHTPIEPIA